MPTICGGTFSLQDSNQVRTLLSWNFSRKNKYNSLIFWKGNVTTRVESLWPSLNKSRKTKNNTSLSLPDFSRKIEGNSARRVCSYRNHIHLNNIINLLITHHVCFLFMDLKFTFNWRVSCPSYWRITSFDFNEVVRFVRSYRWLTKQELGQNKSEYTYCLRPQIGGRKHVSAIKQQQMK